MRRCPHCHKHTTVSASQCFCYSSYRIVERINKQETNRCFSNHKALGSKMQQEDLPGTEASQLVVVQSLSHAWLFATPGTAAHQASLSFTISWTLLNLMTTEVSDAIQLSHPLPPLSPPAFNLSQHQSLFQSVSSSHEVAKVLELQHQSFQWIFRVDFC